MHGIARSLKTTFIASLLMGVAGPALAAQCSATLGLVTALDLKVLPSGRPAVQVGIGGAAKTMLVDTGGAISQITQKTAQELNLVQTRTNQRLVLANGAYTDMLARIPAMTLGKLKMSNVQYFMLPQSEIAGTNEFDGVFASDLLKSYEADFDFPARKLNLFAQDHCAGQLVYWKTDKVAVVPFQFGSTGRSVVGNGVVSNSNPDTHIRFPVDVDGKRINAILDTGANQTFLDLDEARRTLNVNINAPDVEKVGQITGGFSASMYRKRFKTLSFDGVIVNEPDIILEPNLRTGTAKRQPGAGSLIRDDSQDLPPLTLGMSVLRYLHVFVSFQERKLYISTSPPAPASQTAQAPSATQTAQASAAGFCPAPNFDPGSSAPQNPSKEDGMAAMRARNFPLAYATLWPLANKGDAEAERDLGIVLRQSCGKDNKSNAEAWLKKAVDAGDSQGAAVLGDMYEYGDGITKNMPEAFRLLSIGANAGILPAQVDLGELYFTGNGVAQDRYQGMVWTVRAAEKGAPIGLIHIAREYGTGQSLPKDPDKAALYIAIGFERLGPARRGEFQQPHDRMLAQLSKDKLAKIQADAKSWKPAEGGLASVLADADKQRKH